MIGRTATCDKLSIYMNKAFFFLDVNTQSYLMSRSGNLYVPGAERLIPKLRRLFSFARKNGVTIVSPVTANGNEGERKVDDTLLLHPLVVENRPIDRNLVEMVRRHQQIILEAQMMDVFTNPVTEKLLKVLPQRAIVFGLPLEQSVKAAALGLRRRGIKAAVLADVVLPREAGEAAGANDAMRSAGVEFIPLDVLLGASSE